MARNSDEYLENLIDRHDIRVGILGLGWIATDPAPPAPAQALGTANPFSHSSALAVEQGLELIAVADRSPDALERQRRLWGERWPEMRFHAGADELLSEDLDLLIVGTPDDQHAKYVLMGLDAGIPMIFCEKPLATELAEADLVIGRMDEVGATIAVNHVRRWLAVESAARAAALDGSLGPISQVIIDAGGRRAMLYRNLTHSVDLAFFLAGDPEPLWVSAELEPGSSGYGTKYRGDGGTDPAKDPGANIQVGFADGARAYIAGFKSGPGDRSVQVLGPLGRVVIDVLGSRVVRTTRPPVDAHPNTPIATTVELLGGSATVQGIQAGLRDLVDSHHTGRDPVSSARTARRTVAVMDAVLRSEAEGNVRVAVH